MAIDTVELVLGRECGGKTDTLNCQIIQIDLKLIVLKVIHMQGIISSLRRMVRECVELALIYKKD